MNRVVIPFLISICLAGCGGGSMDNAEYAASENAEIETLYDSSESTGNPAAAVNTADVTKQEPEADSGERKIIYTGAVDLVVKDLQDTEAKVKSLVDKNGGYVAQFHQDRRYGDQLETTWTVRIPVGNFEAFIEAVAELGVPESRRIESQEVTKQFRDLSARLDNKRRTEKEYQKLMEDRTKDINDIAAVADRLSQVREEIELIEGELNHLNDRIAMTTVTIHAREDKEYTPPQAPTFAATIKDTFGGSLEALQEFGKGCLLFVVAVAPWLPLVLILAIPPWLLFKRHRKKRAATRRR